MNKTEDYIKQTVYSIGLMQQSLSSLCEDTLPKNAAQFAYFAEGPMDQIRDLLDQMDEVMKKDSAFALVIREAELVEATAA